VRAAVGDKQLKAFASNGIGGWKPGAKRRQGEQASGRLKKMVIPSKALPFHAAFGLVERR
jgi:hypothetical protein